MPMPENPKQAPEQESVVFVIDDDPGVRASLQSLLRSIGLKVETFNSAAEFIVSKIPPVPTCLVLDVRLPGVGGLAFQAELAKKNIQIPIIFITGHGDIPMTVRAMKAGAVEFLPKPFREQDMLDAVRAGLTRDRVRLENDRATAGVADHYQALTPRERQVMALVTSGLMNKQIAGEIGVSEVTIKVHRGNVMRKMGARSLADLVRMADTLGIRRPSP
jgi:FixJ family two-component response regulator